MTAGRHRLGFSIDKLATLVELRFIACISAILLAGALLRLVFVLFTTSPTEPLNRLYPGFTDGEEYLDNARSLVETGTYGYGGRPSAFRPPAYPIVLALGMKIFGETLTPVRLLQIGLFLLMTVCYTWVTRRYFGSVSAALTAVAFSVYPLFIFMATEIATESLYMALASIVFALTFRLLRDETSLRGRIFAALGAGACCGAGTLTRTNMLLTFFLVQGLLLWLAPRQRGPWRSWIAPTLGLWLGAVGILAPWLIRNHLVLGAPVLATNLHYNLFRGTFDLVPHGIQDAHLIFAKYRENDVIYEEYIEDPAITRLPFGEVSNEEHARTAALAIIRSDPMSWIKERIKNSIYLWLNLQWEGVLIANRPMVVAAGILVTMIYYAMLLAALAGSISVWRSHSSVERRQFVSIAWLFTCAAMSLVITFVGKRYRVAMIDPYLAILASIAVASWAERRRRARIP